MKRNIILIIVLSILTLVILSGCSLATSRGITIENENILTIKPGDEIQIPVKLIQDINQFQSIELYLEFNEEIEEIIENITMTNDFGENVDTNFYNVFDKYYNLYLNNAVDLKKDDILFYINVKIYEQADLEQISSVQNKISVKDILILDNNNTEYQFEGVNSEYIFNVIENDIEQLYLKSEKYKIGEDDEDTSNYQEGDKYISRISPNTTISDFINNLSTNGNISVYNANGEEETNYDELIKTRMILKVSKDNQTIELTISVLGDINGNGKVGGDTLTELRGVLYENIEVDEIYIKSLDINGNNVIEAADLTLIRGVLYENEII